MLTLAIMLEPKSKYLHNLRARRGLHLSILLSFFCPSTHSNLNGLWYPRNSHDKYAEAQRYSVKKMFLEISQNSQKKTCAKVSFLIAGLRRATLLKKRLCHIFKNIFFHIIHLVAAMVKTCVNAKAYTQIVLV